MKLFHSMKGGMPLQMIIQSFLSLNVGHLTKRSSISLRTREAKTFKYSLRPSTFTSSWGTDIACVKTRYRWLSTSFIRYTYHGSNFSSWLSTSWSLLSTKRPAGAYKNWRRLLASREEMWFFIAKILECHSLAILPFHQLWLHWLTSAVSPFSSTSDGLKANGVTRKARLEWEFWLL